MKCFQRFLGITASICLIFVLLITAFEIGAYSDFGWYEKEYKKYNVLEDLEMEMEDVMDVTEEMMSYLRGNRKDLNVDTTVDGEEREFFNDREKAHMVDVKNLFVGGMWLRGISFGLFLLSLLGIWLTKADWKKLLPKSFLIGLGAFLGLTAIAGGVFMSDFNKYFTLFHKMFFSNDLWLLDPDTDLMIRMLPEGFFMDMVARIGIIFLAMLLVGVAASIFVLYKNRDKKN